MSKLIEEKLVFIENETVLCFHGPLLYEAKILEVKSIDHKDTNIGKKGFHYFVHYKGWKKTWDEWVSEERIIKFNEENLLKQIKLKESSDLISSSNSNNNININNNINKTKPSREDIRVTQPEYTKISKKCTQKHKRQKIIDENSNQIENKGDSIQKGYDEDLLKDQKIVDNEKKFTDFFETKILMPQPLKIKLIEDWEVITKSQKLYQLPRQITVVDILKEYLDYKQNTINESVVNSTIDSPSKQSIVTNDESSNFEMNKMELYNEITEGILTYFNKCLQKILLYNYERVQNTEIRVAHPDKEYSEIYGAEHLLRLFVEIPQLLSQNEFNQSTAEVIQSYLTDFLKFLDNNILRYFDTNFASEEISFTKKQKTNKKKAPGGLTCANCKTPNTPNWRAGEKPGQKLCNACGLYFSKYGSHRPESRWNNNC